MLALPVFSLASAFVALALWLSGLSFKMLDGAVASVYACGMTVSSFAYLRARPPAVRRLSVVAIGLNGFGLLLLFLVTNAR